MLGTSRQDHGSRTRERYKVRLGRLVGVRRNLECHAKTFSPHPTENGKSIMISSFSRSTIQAQCQASWTLQEILRRSVGGTALALESDPLGASWVVFGK